MSALVRLRNEATKIVHCLGSILPVFDEVVVVDNGSTDGTASIVRTIMRDADPEGKIQLLDYPVPLAAFGPEHDAAPADSLHSAVYYSNWALSHCSHRYVCKWDGDMVLRGEVREEFGRFLDALATGPPACWAIAGQTVYRDLAGRFHLATGEINSEIEIVPYGAECRFVKKRHWEQLRRPARLPVRSFEPVCFFELKYVDEDEFDHWSTTDWPSQRKRREWENYGKVRRGETDSGFELLPPGFLDQQLR